MPVSGELAGAAALAAGLKGLMGYAQDTCRLRAVSPTVQIVEYSSPDRRRMAIHGVHTCKSPLCALCAPKWQRSRSDDISRAIEAHPLGADGVFFVTLTMRHNRKMNLALQHRLQTAAFGSLWGGNAGQKAAALLGGKPESIRAHDRTWSKERGWHPHTHVLLFVRNAELDTAELARLFDRRWPKVLAAALRRFKSQCLRIVTRSDHVEWSDDDRAHPSGYGGCGRHDCRVCMLPFQGPRLALPFLGPLRDGDDQRWWRGPKLGALPLRASDQIGECPHFRERATRMFGVRLFPRVRREVCGVGSDGKSLYAERVVSIHDSALRVLQMLEPFTPDSIRPTKAHGAFVERMRHRDRLPNYLAKLGLELASSLSKLGKEGSDRIRHYGQWEVARLATTHGHPLRDSARRAWSQLFWATRGTQTITFSDREALGLPDDAYAEGGEPDEQRDGERTRVVGLIEAASYRERVAEREHGVLSELAGAYERGELAALGYVDPPGALSRPLRVVPPVRGPPATADPCAVSGDGYLFERPDSGEWESVYLPFEARVIEAADNGTSIAAAYREATALPSCEVVLPDQLRRRLRERIGSNGE